MNFNDTYSRDSFRALIKGLLLDYSDDVRQVSAATPSPHVQEAHLLGESHDLELSVFEIQHSGSADKRISLAQAGFRLMKSVACYRALIAYHSTDTDSWRLSLMTLNPAVNKQGKVSLESSNPRRYSYYLGPDAKTHTPHDRLVKSGAAKNFEDLLARFSVEVVTNEFFKQYRALFEKLVKHLEKDHAFQGFIARSNIAMEDFAKKLLGQIVFIYFLQRKRWVGAKKGRSIHEGDKDFLRTLFQKAQSEQKNFFNEYLEPLFYDGLNNPPKRAGSFYRDYFDCQIPFLNGGLFEPLNNYDWRNAFLFIPDELFSNSKETGILDVFDLYNFTVAEDDPIDVEVSVDPEMLGKVFENLLAENLRKGKGTYYTPRAIVHYMCRESLINYLASESKIDEDKIRQLVEQKNRITDVDLATLDSIEEHEEAAERVLIFDKVEAKKLDDLLEEIKVCDPACGSGAFLVGMLHEIVNARNFLDTWYLGDRYTNYNLKKYAIQNSVYGVDIDPGAVDIAKLRLWLSMVVDYDLDDIEPLPNLDYKIMQGNSLLEELVVGDTTLKLYDPKLNNGSTKKRKKNLFEEDDQQDLFGQTKGQHRLIDELNRLHREYFELSDLKAKRRKREKIKAIEHELVERTVKQELKKLEGQSKNIGQYLSPAAGMSEKDAKEYAENLSKQSQLAAILKDFDASTNRPYFLWHLNFADVFEQKGGFDVVIANPPYGLINKKQNRHTSIMMDENEFKHLKSKYPDASGGMINIFRFFILRSISLLRPGGVFNEIFPLSFVADLSMKRLRKNVLGDNTILSIEVFPERDNENRRVFAGVKMSVCILNLLKSNKQRGSFFVRTHRERFIDTNNEKVKLSKDDIEILDRENLTIPLIGSKDLEILLKVYSQSQKLAESGHCYTGEIDLTIQKKYLTSDSTKARLVKGAIIGKYVIRSKMSQGEIQYLDSHRYLKENTGPKSQHHKFSRIVMQGITGVNEKTRLRMTIIEAGIFCANSVNYIVFDNENVNPKFILAVLNSKIMNYVFSKFSTNSNVNGYEIDNLPIILSPDEKVVRLVDSIFELEKDAKRTNSAPRIAKLQVYEKEIDRLVYRLYDLTPEEIRIVEGEDNINQKAI